MKVNVLIMSYWADDEDYAECVLGVYDEEHIDEAERIAKEFYSKNKIYHLNEIWSVPFCLNDMDID